MTMKSIRDSAVHNDHLGYDAMMAAKKIFFDYDDDYGCCGGGGDDDEDVPMKSYGWPIGRDLA